MPDFQYIVFNASDSYKADPASATRPMLDILQENATGFFSFYSGIGIDDTACGHILIGWDSVASHKALTENKDVYPLILTAFSPSLVAGTAPKLEHFTFDDDLSAVLGAPITEFVRYKGKGDLNCDSIWQKIFSPALDGRGDAVKGSGIGKGIEDPGNYLVGLGWTSEEKYDEANDDPEYNEAVLKGLDADVFESSEGFRVKLTKMH